MEAAATVLSSEGSEVLHNRLESGEQEVAAVQAKRQQLHERRGFWGNDRRLPLGGEGREGHCCEVSGGGRSDERRRLGDPLSLMGESPKC